MLVTTGLRVQFLSSFNYLYYFHTCLRTEQRGYQQGHHADEMDVDDGHRFESAADIHGEGNNVQ